MAETQVGPETIVYPLDETCRGATAVPDALERKNFVEILRNLIDRQRLGNSYSLAICGSWGSGKSWVMEQLEGSFSTEFNVIWFEAWRYENEASLFCPMVSELGNYVQKWALDNNENLPCDWAREHEALKMLAAVGAQGLGGILSVGFPFAGSAISLLWSSFEKIQAKRASKWVDSVRRGTVEFGNAVNKISEFTKRKRTLIFIDDLDRCLPGAVIRLLEDIKHITNYAHGEVVFVIGIDKEAVQKAIINRYSTLNEADAEAYLAKIFRFSIDIPEADRFGLGGFIDSLNNKMQTNFKVQHLSYLKQSLAAARMSNPRKLIRVFKNFHVVQECYKDPENGFRPLGVLMLLMFKHFWPDIYRSILRGDHRTISWGVGLAGKNTIGQRRTYFRDQNMFHPSLDRNIEDESLFQYFKAFSGQAIPGLEGMNPDQISSLIYFCELMAPVKK